MNGSTLPESPAQFRSSSSPLIEKFASSEKWNPDRIRALAMYCSDGRWGDAFDEFCHCCLHIPRYDRFAVPGGPACLTLSNHDGYAPWEQLSMLVEVHELQRLVLVTHYGCAYYTHRLKLEADACIPIQIEDLHRAAVGVLERFPRLHVQMYLAMRRGESLSFHTVS